MRTRGCWVAKKRVLISLSIVDREVLKVVRDHITSLSELLTLLCNSGRIPLVAISALPEYPYTILTLCVLRLDGEIKRNTIYQSPLTRYAVLLGYSARLENVSSYI